MSDPLTYGSRSARHGLPFLFAGQTQKELFVNEALARMDMLVSPTAQSQAAAPPPNPADGEMYIVAPGATGEWSGHDGELAGWEAGAWLFQIPPIGYTVRNLGTGSLWVFDGQWRSAVAPMPPSGGATVDPEARATIDAVVTRLCELGIFSSE